MYTYICIYIGVWVVLVVVRRAWLRLGQGRHLPYKDRQITHTYTDREQHPRHRHTHAHDKNNTPNPQTNTSHKHLKVPPVMTVRAEKSTRLPTRLPRYSYIYIYIYNIIYIYAYMCIVASRAEQVPPVMTVRAEKSTRFPIRFPRTRPSLPLRRCEMALSGRPERVVAGCTPGRVFVMKVARWYCSSETCCSWMWFGAPLRSCSRNERLVRTMSMSLTVRSSSPRPTAESIWIEGRTCAGSAKRWTVESTGGVSQNLSPG